MPAPIANQFWKLRSNHGRDKIFSSPEALWNAACEYFDWVDKHPWKRNEVIKSGNKVGKLVKVPTQRPYTLAGLCHFLKCDQRTLLNYETKQEYKDFFPVIGDIKNIIYVNKFEGAVVGAFNANIISRDLGLVDKLQHGGDPDSPIKHEHQVVVTKVIFEDMTEEPK